MEIVPLSHVAERHWYGAPLYQKRSQEYRMLSILLRRNTAIGERICLGNSSRVQGTYSVKCAPQDTVVTPQWAVHYASPESLVSTRW